MPGNAARPPFTSHDVITLAPPLAGIIRGFAPSSDLTALVTERVLIEFGMVTECRSKVPHEDATAPPFVRVKAFDSHDLNDVTTGFL